MWSMSSPPVVNDALGQKPSDSEILRFSDQFDTDVIRKLVTELKLPVNEWKDMREDHPHNIKMAKFCILIQWRERKSGIFLDNVMRIRGQYGPVSLTL
jgi:hypothetical protein